MYILQFKALPNDKKIKCSISFKIHLHKMANRITNIDLSYFDFDSSLMCVCRGHHRAGGVRMSSLPPDTAAVCSAMPSERPHG